jgi:hypothetical protein
MWIMRGWDQIESQNFKVAIHEVQEPINQTRNNTGPNYCCIKKMTFICSQGPLGHINVNLCIIEERELTIREWTKRDSTTN